MKMWCAVVGLGVLASCGSARHLPAAEPPPEPHAPMPASAVTATESTLEPGLEHDLGAARHLLERFAFGPRPGQVEAVAELGVSRWFEVQLFPAAIEDASSDVALAPYASAFEEPKKLPLLFAKTKTKPEKKSNTKKNEDVVGGEHLDIRRIRETTDLNELLRTIQTAQLVRQTTSERQLHEVMVDFWMNHFNVFARKGMVKFFAGDYVERAIRAHALGRFEDLLVATARHPAMLIYLDNARSTAPPKAGTGAATRKRGGITENYARELLELHTLGVSGGYTQRDVVEVARVLTGWSVARSGKEGLGFTFRTRAHDTGAKVVLGVAYPSGAGEEEGRALLKQLAEHPATARHLATKLCQRFVRDEAPPACVERVAQAYVTHDGDIRSLLRAVFALPDFWSSESRRAKSKTPLEYLVSSLRAVAAVPEPGPGLLRLSVQLGQPPLLQAAPTGYPETAAEWASASGALSRMSFAVRLASGRARGVSTDLSRMMPAATDPDAVVKVLKERFFVGIEADSTLASIRKQIEVVSEPSQRRMLAIALALGSPDFQQQ